MKRGFSVLAYHMVEPRFDFGITRVTPGQFRAHLQVLEKLGLPVVRLDVLRGAPREPRVALTFDDAYLSVYEHALPPLAERQWPATVFVVTDFVGRLNTWDVNLGGLKFPHLGWAHLRELAALGWQIGSHGHTHRYLTLLPDRELREELRRSRLELEDRLGVPVTALAPPYGRVSARVVEQAAELGYRQIALLYAPAGQNLRRKDGIALIPRRGVYLTDTSRSVRRKITGGRIAQHWYDLSQFVIGLGSRGSIAVQFVQTRVFPTLAKMARLRR